MNLDDWLRIALVFSGVIVICTFVIAVIRYPSKAYFWLVGLVFGGLLLIVPKLKNFDIDARTGKIHGEIVNIGDDATQVADIKLYISEVLKMVKSVEEKVANPSAVPATQLDVAKRKDLSVVIVYSSQQRELARRLESSCWTKVFRRMLYSRISRSLTQKIKVRQAQSVSSLEAKLLQKA